MAIDQTYRIDDTFFFLSVVEPTPFARLLRFTVLRDHGKKDNGTLERHGATRVVGLWVSRRLETVEGLGFFRQKMLEKLEKIGGGAIVKGDDPTRPPSTWPRPTN